MSDRFVVIMAGGSGKRFWPLSRRARPKQLLGLVDPSRSLLRRTFDRVRPLVAAERILVVTGAAYEVDVQKELPELPIENVLVEPIGRNTAPCIAWATAVIRHRSSGASIAVLPSDHHVADEAGFRVHLELAFGAAEDPGSPIVLLGIVPTHPETGYGYIRGVELVGSAFRDVAAFVEKPDRSTAEQYLASRDYLWNAGLFVFRASRMEAEIARQLPELFRALPELSKLRAPSRATFERLPNLSIDYGVMENAENRLVLPSSFGWSDVGSFDALYEALVRDELGNAILGDALVIDASGSLVDARAGRPVAIIGAKDLIVVDTKDAVLVLARGHSQDVQKAVARLEAGSRTELL
ncbi:MAG: mannose-1-phosphate guanylyltransferase [Deltaproteobacteria bacterium]|nr:mannose-1-phosphate guanylyltransferase [Deltaproteobacteria bacterium]